MVQLSHPYVTPGKTIALTIWPFVSKAISLLFNMLSRFVKKMNRYLLIYLYIFDVQAGFRKAEEPEIKLPASAGSSKKQESSRKTSISALSTMSKPLTVWITINCGKF